MLSSKSCCHPTGSCGLVFLPVMTVGLGLVAFFLMRSECLGLSLDVMQMFMIFMTQANIKDVSLRWIN